MPGKPSVPVVVDYQDSILALLFPEDFPPEATDPAAGQAVAAAMPEGAPDAPPDVPDSPPDAPEAAGAPGGVPPDVTPPESGPPDGVPPDVGGAPELPLETAGEHALPEAADEEAVNRSPFDRAEIELLAVSGRASHASVATAPDPHVELPGLPEHADQAADVSAPGQGHLPDAVGSHGAPPDLPDHPDAPPEVNPGTGDDMNLPDAVEIHIA